MLTELWVSAFLLAHLPYPALHAWLLALRLLRLLPMHANSVLLSLASLRCPVARLLLDTHSACLRAGLSLLPALLECLLACLRACLLPFVLLALGCCGFLFCQLAVLPV